MLELKSVLEDFRTLPGDLDMGLGTEEFSMSGGNLSKSFERSRVLRTSCADLRDPEIGLSFTKLSNLT